MQFIYNNEWEKGQVPLISIITPVYNRRKEFSRAISSVNVQTYKNFEHIIIDDGSIESQSIDELGTHRCLRRCDGLYTDEFRRSEGRHHQNAGWRPLQCRPDGIPERHVCYPEQGRRADGTHPLRIPEL